MPSVADPLLIRRLLETDRNWSVYALGDLSPSLAPHCAWFCAAGDEPAVLLVYRGFGTPVLFALGEVSAVRHLLDEIGEPRALYLHVRPDVMPLIRNRYDIAHEKAMWRMVLNARGRSPAPAESVSRLGPQDVAALRELYADGEPAGEAPDFFSPDMLTDGVYFGVREAQSLVAAAGTHLVVPSERVAALGNIYTRRDRRGRGLATRATSAVATELLRLGLRTIALNVEQRNAAAIRVYERLGFVRYCPFCEGLASLRNR